MFGERAFLPEDVPAHNKESDQTRPFPKLKLVPDLTPKREVLPPLREDHVTPKETPRTISSLDFKIGKTFQDQHGDRYVVKKELGKGGMGSVFEIEQERMIGQERVGIERALKIIRPDSMDDVPAAVREKLIKRFQREMDIVSKLHNPFILPVTDVIEIQLDGKKIVGLVTDVVEGTNLEEMIIKKDERLSPERIIEFIGELVIALETLRKVGLVHRDIKPANIFLQEMPKGKQIVRLGDFGLVAFEDQMEKEGHNMSDLRKSIQEKKDARITDPGFVIGSPSFMSPEQVKGEQATHQSDLYSLGVVMYEMIARKPMFDSRLAFNVMSQHLFETPKSFLEVGIEEVPPWLEEIVMKLVSKDPKDRFRSAAEVFAALKVGVKKDYPKMLNEIPFNWNIA